MTMTDTDQLVAIVQQLNNKIAAMSDLLARTENEKARQAALPADDDIVFVRTGAGLYRRDVYIDFKRIKHRPGLKFDEANNVWNVDSLPGPEAYPAD